MSFGGWRKTSVKLDSGEQATAACPVIISASRATDIPAFYAEWLMRRLKKGYVVRPNPFNHAKPHIISFRDTRLCVFWTKNARPLMQYLPQLDRLGLNYYFQFTINDYENCGLEPGLPPLEQRIETFIELSHQIGRERIIWRFDPLILTDKISVNSLLQRISGIADRLCRHTGKLVFSFADISGYRRVKTNLTRHGISYREFTTLQMREFAAELQRRNREWNLQLATCAEDIALEEFGIEHNRCIDDNLIVRLFQHDVELMSFMGYTRDMFNSGSHNYFKDKGQRPACGCMVSKDIGTYSTCRYNCVYCYANTSGKRDTKS